MKKLLVKYRTDGMILIYFLTVVLIWILPIAWVALAVVLGLSAFCLWAFLTVWADE